MSYSGEPRYEVAMTTRVYLVRHGATLSTAEDRFSGSADVELSDEGKEQARLLGERLASEPVRHVYASPMRRTLLTAELIAAPHGLSPFADDALREIHHGHWEGVARAEVEQRFPGEFQAWEADPFTYAPPGGESGVRVMARALPAIRRMVEQHDGETVVVVSHKATIRLVLCALLGIDARGYRDRLDQDPAALNALDFKDVVRARLILFNDISHYSRCPADTQKRLSTWWDHAPR
jgi:probable phosphoglycerate mutase